MDSMDVWTARRPVEPTAPVAHDLAHDHAHDHAYDHPGDLPVPAPAGVPAPKTDTADTQVPSRRWTRRLLRVVGTVVGVAVTVAFTTMALLPVFGMRTMIVLSGSMAPAFHTGDAVVVEHTDPDRVQVGDMIAFTGYGTEQLTTHRVIGLHDVKGKLHFRTQGDANPDPDANLAPAGGLHGRVRLVLPHAGRVLATMTGQRGKLLILGLPALILAAGQLRALIASARTASARTASARTASAGNYRPGVVAATVTILAVATITGATLVQTMATFTDAHPAGDNTFTTGTFSA